MSEQLTVKEACKVLRIGKTSLYKLVAAREIKPTRPRGVRRTTFSRQELERFLARYTRPAR